MGAYASPGYASILVLGADANVNDATQILSSFNPDPMEELEVNRRVWTVYEVVFEGTYEGVMAITPVGSGEAIYLILLVTTDDPDDVRTAILGPVIEAFEVIE